jgi:hypothetical protein
VGADEGGRVSRIRCNEPTVAAKPFADWLKAKTAEYSRELPSGNMTKGGFIPLGPCERLACELGWGDNSAGVRRLYRYQNQLVERSMNSRTLRWLETADMFARSVVENACHHYDPHLFYRLYPELEHERDVMLEPDAWCPFCAQWVTPVDGLCPWCVCSHGHLFREVGVTEDGFACVACLAAEQREARQAA